MNDKSIKLAKVYVELDCLLDTRLALLHSEGSEYTDKALQASYYERKMDDFPGMPFETFLEKYAARDRRLLKNAMLTKINFLVREFAATTVYQTVSSPFHTKPCVVINAHPYRLKPEEEQNIITAMVSLTNGLADVELVYKSPDEVTPLYLKREMDLAVMYHGADWVERHSANDNLKTVTCPEVVVLSPALFLKRPSAKELAECSRLNMTPFQAFEKLASPLVGIRFIAVEHFCIDIKLVPVKAESVKKEAHKYPRQSPSTKKVS